MKISVIDLGTVSTRFDIYEIRKSETPRLIAREKVMQRIGENIFETKIISKEAITRNISEFKKHLNICKSEGVDKIIAVGTSALRVANNSQEFISQLKNESGIELRVISGEEEARLIAKGIISNEEVAGPAAFVDIGGGSTEISIYKDEKIIFAKSFELGASRLQEVFLKKSPPEESAVNQLIEFTAKKLAELDAYKIPKIIGSSGTIRSLVKIANDNNPEIKGAPSDKVLSLIESLIPLNREEILAIPGMEENRADIILAGCLLFREIMRKFECSVVERSLYSLRHGIAWEEVEKLG